MMKKTLMILFLFLFLCTSAYSVERNNNLILGKTDQTIRVFSISEPDKGVMDVGEITITLPDGFKIQENPVIRVIKGDLKAELKKISDDEKSFSIEIEKKSREKSSLEISGLIVTIDRTLASGPYYAKIGGSSLVNPDLSEDMKSEDYVAKVYIGDIAEIKNEKIPEEQTDYENLNLVFEVGSKEYKKNKINYELNNNLTIKYGEVMLPLKDVTHALGIAAKDLKWIPEENVVSMHYQGDFVTMQLGNKEIGVDDYKKTIKIAPEIIDGRTYLPLEFFEKALNLEVFYDSSTNEVVMNEGGENHEKN